METLLLKIQPKPRLIVANYLRTQAQCRDQVEKYLDQQICIKIIRTWFMYCSFRKDILVFSCHVISKEMERAGIVLSFKKVNFLELSISQNNFVCRAIRER